MVQLEVSIITILLTEHTAYAHVRVYVSFIKSVRVFNEYYWIAGDGEGGGGVAIMRNQIEDWAYLMFFHENFLPSLLQEYQ